MARVAGTAALALCVGTACQAPSGERGERGRIEPTAPEQVPSSQAEVARRLREGWALLDAGDVAGAAAVRDAVRGAVRDAVRDALFGGLPEEVLLRGGGASRSPADEARLGFKLLDAGLALARGDVDAAAEWLEAVVPATTEHRLRHALLSADVAAARGDPVGAVAMLLHVEATHADHAGLLGRAVWRHGTRAQGHRLAVRALQAATVEERAWWTFLRTYNEALTPARQRALWLGWRQGRGSHPAAVVRPAGLEEASPARVAVLLPLSGPLASAGAAVRDGFLAAYFAAGPLPSQSILLYDTALAGIEALYEEALAVGADRIVGPLSKENAARMWRLDPVIPTITLNSVPDLGAPGEDGGAARVVQFALAVEDEARALAGRVDVDGRRRIMVFRDRSEWSDRAAATLEASLPETVSVVDVRAFPDITEVTAVVGEAFAVEESQARMAALGRLFGGRELQFTARRRADVDGVVALLDADHADSLGAALRFHAAAKVPLYSSSQGLRGDARALEGARVCDIPWRLYPPGLKGRLQGPFDGIGDTAEPLFAFGVDAFRIVHRLSHLAASTEHRVMGATGVLALGRDGLIHRDLAWAVVRDGAFRPLPSRAPGAPGRRR